jgi:hypothetical protein
MRIRLTMLIRLATVGVHHNCRAAQVDFRGQAHDLLARPRFARRMVSVLVMKPCLC